MERQDGKTELGPFSRFRAEPLTELSLLIRTSLPFSFDDVDSVRPIFEMFVDIRPCFFQSVECFLPRVRPAKIARILRQDFKIRKQFPPATGFSHNATPIDESALRLDTHGLIRLSRDLLPASKDVPLPFAYRPSPRWVRELVHQWRLISQLRSHHYTHRQDVVGTCVHASTQIVTKT